MELKEKINKLKSYISRLEIEKEEIIKELGKENVENLIKNISEEELNEKIIKLEEEINKSYEKIKEL